MKRFYKSLPLAIFVALILSINAPAFQNGEQGQSNRTKATNSSAVSDELKNLTGEIHKLNNTQQQLIKVLMFQLIGSRLEKLQDKQFGLSQRLDELNGKLHTLELKLNHIDDEVTARNIINRQEGEIVVRNQLLNEFQEVKKEHDRLERELKATNLQTTGFLRFFMVMRHFNSADPKAAAEKDYLTSEEFDRIINQLVDLYSIDTNLN